MKRPLNKLQRQRIRDYFNDDFSIEELAIMYNVRILVIERILENE